MAMAAPFAEPLLLQLGRAMERALDEGAASAGA